ncbi:MAG: endolytic transglycosylase MltG [Pseudomonadota bacterium]|nr:endolytic transglycosylase MltG [Pseudomonadota bacterium]
MRSALRLGLLVAVVVVVATVFIGFQWWKGADAPGPLGAAATVVVPRGEGPRAIADRLTGAGVITDRYLFLARLRVGQLSGRLQAGEYLFPAAISLSAVIDQLVAGRTVVRKVTVPEGLTVREIRALLDDTPGLEGPTPEVAEGSLLPETYHYALGDTRAALVARMQAAMREVLAELWAGRKADLPLATPEEALVLASIVEKETGIAAERPLVAGVFVNRLRLGMRLQSDPTVIHAVTGGEVALDRALTRSDLRFESPYNTYLNAGLPPGPIACPGRDAIAAVLDPAETDDLYFVADGTGGHAFAKTLDAHNRNVRRWRKLQREQQ